MRSHLFLAGLCASGLVSGGDSGATPPSSPDTFVRDYAETRGFTLGRPLRARPTPEGKAVLFLRAQARQPTLELFEFEVATGRTRRLLSPAAVLGGRAEHLSAEGKARRERMRVSLGGFTDFQLSEDGARCLLSLGGELWVYERASGRARQLPTGAGSILDPQWAPDGKSGAYVLDHDVWTLALAGGSPRRVTRGGTARLTHGLAEFVAQEEMDRFHGYWWAPDSQAVAFEEADASGVAVWYVADPAQPGQAPSPVFYPRPGQANVRVRLGIARRRGGPPVWVEWDRARYPYLARVDWHRRGGLTLLVQTRDQRDLRLLRADPRTGRTHTLLDEHDPAWVNLDQAVPRWRADGRGFLWTTERRGAWQLELRDPQGGLLRVLTPIDLGFQALVDLDDQHQQAWFLASADPTQAQLYRVPLAGGPPVALTREPGLHAATLSKDGAIYTHQVTTPEALPRTFVCRADGQVVGELPSVAAAPPFVPRAQILRVGKAPGRYALVVRPRMFDSRRRYPVLDHVYGGPHAKMVSAALGGQLLDQWLADQGFIVVSVDGRGTPGRGRAWERAIQNRFGTLPVEEQVAGLQDLGAQFPEMDLTRVGAFGWSFGGYLAALTVLRRPDVFKAAVAGAPVTDWEDYDTHYTERYLGLPAAEPAGYQEGSLIALAPGLQRPLLLVHGTADDNVYFRHTLRLADALFRAGKSFEVLPLPGFTHMVPEPIVTERLYGRISAFFQAHL